MNLKVYNLFIWFVFGAIALIITVAGLYLAWQVGNPKEMNLLEKNKALIEEIKVLSLKIEFPKDTEIIDDDKPNYIIKKNNLSYHIVINGCRIKIQKYTVGKLETWQDSDCDGIATYANNTDGVVNSDYTKIEQFREVLLEVKFALTGTIFVNKFQTPDIERCPVFFCNILAKNYKI